MGTILDTPCQTRVENVSTPAFKQNYTTFPNPFWCGRVTCSCMLADICKMAIEEAENLFGNPPLD